ncbi:hypothetical protein L2E82_39894 [Cichorium intybus]|uniref:Uncharacterized protein n=1 Tax=Cichorium intybus TaxID=13427 RepID=A0ACB9AJJ4_CICIN|nr:hypothetical protein L2E82_39894 [Cichorium intybus]
MALLSSLKEIFGIESCSLSKDFMPEFFKLVLETLSLPINLPNTNYHHGLQNIYELKQKLLYTTLELEAVKAETYEKNEKKHGINETSVATFEKQGSQQPIGSSFNFPSMENPNSQPSPGEWPSQTFRDGSSVGGMLQGSQGGYGVDYATPATQAGFPGSFLDKNSQGGFSRFGTGNDFMSQVRNKRIKLGIFLKKESL